MAGNVFGTAITNETLSGMPEYAGKTITARDRAHEAIKAKNDGVKDVNARNYVENLKAQYGNGISALAVIYNATGGPLNFVTHHDYYGYIWTSFYPTMIQNGQWGAFLHVHPTAQAIGASGVVVYRGTNNDGAGREWMLGWSIPYLGPNHVYTEIREAGHFGEGAWSLVYDLMMPRGNYYTDYWGGCVSTASIANGTSPIYEGLMTLENAQI